MIVDGIFRLMVGNLIAILVTRVQGDMSIDVVLFYLFFLAIGLEPIYRANRSRIEFRGSEIFYMHPLFTAVFKWDDFVGLRVTSDGVVLKFLNSRIASSKFVVDLYRAMGIWDNNLPLSPYLTFDNRSMVWEVIQWNLHDDHEKKILEMILTS